MHDYFYCPDFDQSQTLSQEESHHCVKVMRKSVGDIVGVIDGKGNSYLCTIVDANPREVKLLVTEREDITPYWTSPIHIAVAPTKHADRMEWLVEKLTEVGVDSITPLLCRWSERKEIKTERLEKIAVAAMKQSLKATLPRISPMTPWKQFLCETVSIPQKFIAHCEASQPRQLLAKAYNPSLPAVIAIGPEGDFSPEEIAQAIEAGYQPISLGEARLRTETAALVACNTCHICGQLHT